jgi:serine/threonine protein phosphatase PrpC
MMSDQRSRVPYALEQSPGTISPEPPQQDRVHVEEIRTRGGLGLILAVVVDGDGHLRAGEAAEIVTEKLFSGVSQSVDRDLNALLRDQLEEGAHALYKAYRSGEGIGEVGATVVAIHRGRLFFAHSGHTMALLVREGGTTQITRSGDRLLGNYETPRIQTGDPRGIALQAGDRVVLASDGLTRISPEDGLPFVGMDKIATYIEGSSPLDATRHLISLALGRDVDDNVSVIVIQIRGERVRASPVKILMALITLAFILTLGVIGISRLRRESTLTPVDYGYAVLVQGSTGLMNEEGTKIVETVGYLGTIPTGSRVVSNDVTRLALETTFEGLINLSGTSLYLDRETHIQLTSLDPHSDPSGTEEVTRETLTIINLISGRLLVVRDEGDRELHITWNGITLALTGEGFGAFGVWDDADKLAMDCLQGQCMCNVMNGESTMLTGGQRCLVINGTKTKVEDLSRNSFQEWNTLCGRCLIEQ